MYANGDEKNLFYIFGGKELTGLYMKEKVGRTETQEMGYVISDHLGSPAGFSAGWALANESGGFIEQYAYDAWGKRMNPTDWTQPDTLRTTFKTDRGFTLHEHYDHMQIINMNARMMDPIYGAFISVDPLADKYPGWGPYVYCMNNPLIYVDPTGEYWEDWDEVGNILTEIGERAKELADAISALKDNPNLTDEQKDNVTAMYTEMIDELVTSIDDIARISQDTENGYRLANNQDLTKYNVEKEGKGKFMITYNKNDKGTAVHEIRHIGQIMRRGEDVNNHLDDKDGKTVGFPMNFERSYAEFGAHRAQYAYNPDSNPVNNADNLNGINIQFLCCTLALTRQF